MGCGSSGASTADPDKVDEINYNNFILRHENRSYKEDYLIGKLLGEGSFGQVYVCKHKKNGDYRVLKKMAKEGLTDDELKKNMVTDVAILTKIAHPSVIKTYEFYSDEYMFYIVSEFCEGGPLLDRVVSQEQISEKETASVMRQVLEAINYCHEQGIVHRDLKLENIVLDEKTQDSSKQGTVYPIKVIDFGCATYYKPGQKLKEICGTPLYIAPEVLKQDYDEKCDIWSIGVLMYILLCGCPPFHASNMDNLFETIKKGEFEFHAGIFDQVSQEAKDLITKMLTLDPKKRPSARELLQEDWLKNAKELTLSEENKQATLKNLKQFQVKSHLQNAVLSYIATQLVTKAEQKNMSIAFKEIDENGNGILTKDEIKNYFSSFMIGEELDDHVDQIMNKVDLNQNGSINYNEFITSALEFNSIVSDQNLKTAFQFFDQDKNGYITSDEVKSVLDNDLKKNQLDTKELLRQIEIHDTNKDNKISFDEFKEMMKNLNSQELQK